MSRPPALDRPAAFDAGRVQGHRMTEADDVWAAHVMRVAPNLHPEHFQPWNDWRPDGRTLFEAMLAFVYGGLRGQVSMHLAKKNAGIERQDTAERLHGHCWLLLLDRLRRGELTASGRLHGELNRQTIRADLFDEAEPDFGNNRITCCGITFLSVRVLEAGATPAPIGEVAASEAVSSVATYSMSPSLDPTLATTSRKDKGGASPKPGWPAFTAEVVRYADLDGIKSKRELNRHMKEWCALNWPDAPDESTIRRKIAEFCPHAPP